MNEVKHDELELRIKALDKAIEVVDKISDEFEPENYESVMSSGGILVPPTRTINTAGEQVVSMILDIARWLTNDPY